MVYYIDDRVGDRIDHSVGHHMDDHLGHYMNDHFGHHMNDHFGHHMNDRFGHYMDNHIDYCIDHYIDDPDDLDDPESSLLVELGWFQQLVQLVDSMVGLGSFLIALVLSVVQQQ